MEMHSKSKLTDRQKMQLALALSEYEYSCGAPATPPSHSLSGKVFMRLNLTCESIIELPYYSSSIARTDLCCHCAAADTPVDQELKKQYKTVLPVCVQCAKKNLMPPCLRPYGKPQK